MQSLLTCGVSGSRIVMVQPPQKPPTSFNNPDIEALLEKCLQEAGMCTGSQLSRVCTAWYLNLCVMIFKRSFLMHFIKASLFTKTIS